MKVFKTRALAILMTMCMMLSLLPISALAAEEGADVDSQTDPVDSGEGYSLTIDLGGTGVTWYAKDEEGAEIDDENYAIPPTEIEVDTDGDVPTVSVTTTLYVKANPGYSLEELTDLVIEGNDEQEDDDDLLNTLDIEITDEAEYCDLKVTLIFDGYAMEGKSQSVTLTIDADPVYELSLDLKGTGVTWYAKDEEGAEIDDENYAIPPTEIEVDTDGDVPTINVTTTLYVKANPGYSLEELTDLVIEGNDEQENDDDLPTTLDIEITDEAEYCDLKVTLVFDGYVMEGKSQSITLTIDADPTYLTLMAGDTKLDISKASTVSYDDAEAIVCGVEYNAEGTTVPVIASVADPEDSVAIGYPVVEGVPAYDEESHTGVNAFVDVTPENTIDNPVYVAVKYIPNKEGATEAQPYDEFFKIALYMTPATTVSFTDVSPSDYYYEAVDWAAVNGITFGTDDTHFSPNNGCTRAQFVTFLWRAAGSPEPAGAESKFSDVSETVHAGYYDAILWASEQGIAAGTGDGSTFSPDDVVTRAQSVTFMCRYAQKAGIATKTGVSEFDDVANEGAMTAYYDAIGWAAANGITAGNSTTANTFGPMDDCNRGMMITFLYRLFTAADA